MIQISCGCGSAWEISEEQINTPTHCRKCSSTITCVCAEALADGAGAADFDAALVISKGPARGGDICLLGGCAPIEIGKLSTRHISLLGNLVSRAHCQLERLDFGPSRWAIQDNQSTNGLFVNGQRVTRHELRDGDNIRIGDYELLFQIADPVAALEPLSDPASMQLVSPQIAAGRRETTGQSLCPSCDKPVAAMATICVPCGIRVQSGRPLLTSQGLDINTVHENARNVVRFVSFILPVTPLPIPLASEAYGRSKPYAIWAIAAITVLISLIFFAANMNDPQTPMRAMMLWPFSTPDPSALSDRLINDLKSRGQAGSNPAEQQQIRNLITDAVHHNTGEFQLYQLFTHALLHDPSGVISFALHLGGNMLFMLVFGSRVNAIIGNIATAVLYPILAIAAATVYLMTLPVGHFGAMLGASGAINGLAGMYLILFPVHRVYCGMWIRLRFWLAFKVFTLRGFWVLLIYFAFDTLMVAQGSQGGTAHWAHIGGFLSGMVLGLGLLASRQFDCRNGDLLSISLGKYAWPLIGKPSQRPRFALA